MADNTTEPMTFEKELAALFNKYNLDAASNTPDYVLARYLIRQYDVFRETTAERETWFGVKLQPGMVNPNDNSSNSG